jgi:hypothetical protein
VLNPRSQILQPDNKEDKTIAEPERELCPSDQSKSGNGAEEEGSLFREAMAGVEPLQSNKVKARAPGPLSKPSRRPLLEGELEAYAQLVDLVSGEGSFDIEYTDEYIEGAVLTYYRNCGAVIFLFRPILTSME